MPSATRPAGPTSPRSSSRAGARSSSLRRVVGRSSSDRTGGGTSRSSIRRTGSGSPCGQRARTDPTRTRRWAGWSSGSFVSFRVPTCRASADGGAVDTRCGRRSRRRVSTSSTSTSKAPPVLPSGRTSSDPLGDEAVHRRSPAARLRCLRERPAAPGRRADAGRSARRRPSRRRLGLAGRHRRRPGRRDVGADERQARRHHRPAVRPMARRARKELAAEADRIAAFLDRPLPVSIASPLPAPC